MGGHTWRGREVIQSETEKLPNATNGVYIHLEVTNREELPLFYNNAPPTSNSEPTTGMGQTCHAYKR